jgi:hypothetical protein
MNADHFDALTKTLASSTSRRAAIKAVAGVAFAGVLTRFAQSEALAGLGAQSGQQTLLVVTNNSGSSVQAYLTFGAVPGCMNDVRQVPWNITVTDTRTNQQGYFNLDAGQSVSYTPPSGMGISGNVAFGSAPMNCPPGNYPNGINLGEFILNNAFQGAGAQETIDNSCVDGVNATIMFSMTGGGAWNGGPTKPNVTSFQNQGRDSNVGLVGVFPWGCDNCTVRTNPPSCQSYTGACQPASICNVQRDAVNSGGTVTISFGGFI